MIVELKGKYYKAYLEKINEKISKKSWSLHALHHKNLNRFIQERIMKLGDGALVLDAGCGLSLWLTKEIEKKIRYVGIDCQEESIVKWYRYGGHLEKRVIETKLLEVRYDNEEKELFEAV